MRVLLLVGMLCACNDDDPPADAGRGGATCEAFCAQSRTCDPQALDPTRCVEDCAATIAAECRTCVVENTCEAIAAGACDSPCG